MNNKDFDMTMDSIKGSLAIEGMNLDEAFVEEYRKYHQGVITWKDFKTMYPYIGEEPLLDGRKIFDHVEKKLQEVNMAQNYKDTEKGLMNKALVGFKELE